MLSDQTVAVNKTKSWQHLLLWTHAQQLTGYVEVAGLDGAKDGRTSARIQAHAHILPAEQQQESHNLRIKGVYHENYGIIGA